MKHPYDPEMDAHHEFSEKENKMWKEKLVKVLEAIVVILLVSLCYFLFVWKVAPLIW